MAEKRGKLTGGAATDEAVLSSRGTTAPNRAGGTRGLQQYFTPPAAAAFVASVTGRYALTLDLTAGDGSLLSGVVQSYRYGVELDGDQVASARRGDSRYAAIAGDVQKVYPLLAAVGLKFDAVLLNPPFGLPWEIPGLGSGNSAALTAKMGLALLRDEACGALICGAERFEREIRAELGDHLSATVRVEKLFPGTDTPCTIAFFRSDLPRREDSPIFANTVAGVGDLTDSLRSEILEAECDRFSYRSVATSEYHRSCGIDPAELNKGWDAARAESDRRRANAPRPDGVTLHGKRIRVRIGAFAKLSMVAFDRGLPAVVESFDGQPPSYFALRPQEWPRLLSACAAHELPISPEIVAAVTAETAKAARATRPLYPVSPAQRLAYLTDLAAIRCVRDDPERGFTAGSMYPIQCETQVMASTEARTKETVEGPETFSVIVERRALQITIGGEKFNEEAESLRYILAHFEVPDPGDLASEHGEEVAYWEKTLRTVEAEIAAREPGFRFRTFQVRDLARLLVKVADSLGGLLAWEMGLGKALAQGAIARALELAGRLPDGCALFVMPQDLAAQFSAEMLRFFGVSLLPVGYAGRAAGDSPRKGFPDEVSAVEVRARVAARRAWLRGDRSGPEAPKVWGVTWFEAIAVTQAEDEPLPLVPVFSRRVTTREAVAERSDWSNYDPQTRSYARLPAEPATYERRTVDSSSACPRCRADRDGGWDGTVCRAPLRSKDGKDSEILASRRAAWGGARLDAARGPKSCGYVHRRTLRKPAYSVLRRTFRFVAVDEGTKIQGDSLASRAVRAFKPRFRVLCTGTPLKNYVHQMFWLLWWALGDSSARFPYGYSGGQDKFLADFGVVETRLDEHSRKERGAKPKVLPEVSNLLYLWRTLCGAVVRRRMDEVGAVVSLAGDWACPACSAKHHLDMGAEWVKPASLACASCGEVCDAIVPLTFKPITVPWGVRQQKQYARWLDKSKFASWFLGAHPGSPLQQAKNPHAIAELLAASIGQGAKLEYACTDPSGDRDSDGDPWTPSRLQLLQDIEGCVKAGKQVLYGSCLVAPGPWVAARLKERGINAAHLTEADADGKAHTKAPKVRSKIIADFRAGKIQVLCTSVNSMALGHNLDVASEVFVEGLPWDFLGFVQFLARVRRLTSKRPVTARIYMPPNSLASRKWDLLQRKGASSDLALDGHISDRTEEKVDQAKVLRDLAERGVRADGTEVPEAAARAAWYGEREAA